jgi:hypothetical protein
MKPAQRRFRGIEAMTITIQEFPPEVDAPDTGYVEEPELTCEEIDEEIASEAVCEYCLPPGKKVITRHGLMPAETLPDGRRVHRIIHLCSFEPPGKSIPCRLRPVKTQSSRYSWTGNYERTAPAKQL